MSMKVGGFIPIKSRSTRVPHKNFRFLSDKELYKYVVDTALESEAFDDVFVDTDNDGVVKYCEENGAKIIERKPELQKDSASGNDLLNYWYELYSDYDYYFQLFVTSPFMKSDTIVKCVEKLKSDKDKDSIFTVSEKCGWYWFEGEPINYNPKALPRSQDAKKVFSESTALYGITNDALKRYQCRIGEKPIFHFVDDIEATDIDSEFDFKIAEFIKENLDA